jgi:hypothetical protein
MTYQEYLKANNISPLKTRTASEYFQQVYNRQYNGIINSYKNIVGEYNNVISSIDFSKYDDYSVIKDKLTSFSIKSGKLLQRLENIQKFIPTKEYENLKQSLSEFNITANSNISTTQNAIDFYSNFKDEEQYKDYAYDVKFRAQYGQLTRKQVKEKLAEYNEKIKPKINGVYGTNDSVGVSGLSEEEHAFYKWLLNYDYRYGIKNEEYYNQLLKELETKRKEHELDVDLNSLYKKTSYAQYSDFINRLKAARTNYVNENVFEIKGHSKSLEAEDFEKYEKIGAEYYYDTYVKVELREVTFFDDDSNMERTVVAEATKEPFDPKRHDAYIKFTPDEKRVYHYYLGVDSVEGTNKAEQFLKDMEITISKRVNNEIQADFSNDMKQGGFKGTLATIAYNALSIPANVVGGIPAVIATTSDLISGEDINVYGSSFALVNFANTVRSTTGEMIGSNGWNLVYQSLMSAADSFVGATAFGGAYPYLMATTAAANRARELVEQGASDGQIIVGSLASGLIEMATEKVSIEHFLDDVKPATFKQWLLSTTQQAGIEASEEVASEVLNKITDEAVMGSMSKYNQLVRKYMQEDGLSEAEAKDKASQDAFKDVFEAFVGGIISGGAMGGVGGMAQMSKFKAVGDAIIKKGEVDNVLLAATSMGKLDPEIAGQVDALTKYAKKHNGTVNNATFKKMLGKVAVATAQKSTDVKQNIIESAIKSALSKRGIDGKVLSKIINAVSKYITGQRLTSAEQNFIKNNSVAGELIREIAAAQKVVNSEASQKADMINETAITENGENNTSSAAVSGGAPEWAVTLVRQLNLIDGATEIVNAAVTGKTKEEAKTQERNRMIKLLSIASGKTTAQQEAEAGDIPYSQYIKQKEAAAKKENTAESGEDSNGSDIEISEADRKKQAERKEKVKSLCDLFGLSLEWDEEIKRGKYNPKNRMVSLNPNLTLTEMYIEVLKHEFTHDLENRRLYKGFKEFLFGKSINFRDYCETALKNDYGEELKGDEAIKRLTQLKYRDYMSSDEMSDEEKAAFDNEAAEREIVADFVAERLLGGIGTDGKFEHEAYEALKELSEYHRSGFQRFVDWIKELINKIKGQPTFKDMADELEYLNKQIAKVYDSRVSTNETVLDGEQHSIKDDSIKQQLKNNESKLNSMDVIASYNTKKFFEYNQQVVEWVVELYEKINYKVTRSGFGEIILDEKRIKKGMRYTKDNYARKIAFAIIPDVLKKGIQIGFHKKHKNRPYDTYTFAAPVEINGMRGNMAVVVRQDGKNYYKAHQIVMPDGTQMIIDEKRDTAERAGGVENNSGLSPTDNVSIDIIPDNSNTVKGNSDSTGSHSIAVPFSEEFKAEKRKKYAEGLVKKYGGDINGAELENYLKEISIAADNNSYSEALKIAHKMAQYISENSAKEIQKTVHKNKIKEIFNSFFSKNKVVNNRTELEGRLSKAVELLMESKTDTENEQALSEADSIIEDLARELVEAPDENSEEYKRLQDIKNVLSMARIKITDEIENGDFKDGFADFRRRNRGKIWLSKSGVDLNEVYEELTSEFGEELFPSNIEGAVEKLSRISEVINARFGADGSLLEGTDEAVESIKNEIHSAVDKIIEDTLDDENVKPEDNLAEKLFDMAVYNRTEEISYKAKEAQKKISEKKNRKFTNATKQRFVDMDKTVDEIVKAELEAREIRQDRQKNIEAIRKTVNSLYKKLTTNSNTKHIPEGFKWAVMDICEIFYRSDLTVFDRRDFHTLSSMYDEVSKESKGEGLDTESVFDEEISKMIRTIADAIDGKRLNQLNSVQVAVLRNIIDNINHIVNEEDKIRIAGKKYETETLGREAIKDFSGKKRVANLPLIEGSRNFFKYNNLSPVYFFENVGDTLKKLYDEIRRGMDKVAYNLDYTKNYITDVKEKYNYDSWKNKTVELDTEYGGKLTLSIEQAMQLYATAKRELTNKTQESRHIFAGGIVFESKDLKERLKNISKSNKKSEIINELLVDEMADTAINITLSDITALSTKLSDEQIEYVNSIVKYMSENMAALGNETSLELYGIRKFNEDYYIPYKTSDDYLATQPGYKPPKTHQSASFTKNTVKKASTPIVIEGFSNVAAKHCNQMIMYNALTVPLNNLTKIYNFNQNVGAEDERSQSLKSLISTTMGTGANKYIEQFIKDMNGDARIAVGEEASNKLLRIFKANAVMASASVVIQQPASIGRAIAYIEPKYFFGVKNGKGDYEQLKKYCGAAIFKEMGRFDTGLGAGTTDWLLQTKPKGVKNKTSAFLKNEQGYRDDAFSYAASKADEITWSTIWRAAKNKVYAETNLKVDSEEFLIEAGKLVSEVIDKTQVYDSTISRSQIMRSSSTIVKMATAFMAEPTVTLNMLYDAAKDFSSKNYKKGLSKVSAVAVTAVLTALLKSLVTAARDDDEYKSYLEKYLSDVATESIDNLLPFNMLPYIRDIYSIIQGYDVKRSDMEAIDTLVSAAKSLFDAEESVGKKFDTFLDALGAFIGIPYKNISRDFMAVFNTGKSFIQGENKTTWDGIWYAICEDLPIGAKKDSKSVNYDRLLNAAESGDKEKFDKVKDHLEELGEDDAAIKSGLKKSIKKNSDEYQDDFQDYMNRLYRIAFFNNLSAEEKKNVENNISNFVAEEIVTDIIGEEPEKKGEKKNTDPYDKVREAENKGIGAEYYYLSKIATNKDNADYNKNGSVTKKEKLRAVREMDIPSDIKAALIALYR